MARILIDALSATTGGALSVARGLSGSLALECPEWRFVLLCSDASAAPAATPPNLEVVEMPEHRSLLRRTLWQQIVGPRLARERGFDAWVLMSGFVPAASPLPKISLWQNAYLWASEAAGLSPGLRRKLAVQKRMMRFSMQRTGLNVFLSQDSLDTCRRAMGVPEDRAAVIPLGLDSEWLERQPPPDHAQREPLLVMVGDLYVHKGYDLALRALALLAPSHPQLRLAIAGAEVDPRDRRALERLAAELGLVERVDFLGRLARPELTRLYERGRVYLAASRLETFGLTPLEAMARGLPVVSSRLSATPEVCGDAAVCFDPYTPEALAAELRGLLASESRWREHRAAGLARARDFDWSTIAVRYRSALESLISRG